MFTDITIEDSIFTDGFVYGITCDGIDYGFDDNIFIQGTLYVDIEVVNDEESYGVFLDMSDGTLYNCSDYTTTSTSNSTSTTSTENTTSTTSTDTTSESSVSLNVVTANSTVAVNGYTSGSVYSVLVTGTDSSGMNVATQNINITDDSNYDYSVAYTDWTYFMLFDSSNTLYDCEEYEQYQRYFPLLPLLQVQYPL